MSLLLHVGDRSTAIPAEPIDGDLVLTREGVLDATSWEVQDHGLCRGDVCRPASLGQSLPLGQLAAALGCPLALEVDGDESVAVLGEAGGTTG